MKKWPHPPTGGVLHFVTVVTRKRIPLFRSAQLCREFFLTLAEVRARFPFELFAYVLLPDHLHLLLRPTDGDISALIQKIKSLAAKRVLETLRKQGNRTGLTRLIKDRPGRRAHTYQVFQDSFRDLQLWSPWMVKQKVDYIHKNPIEERLVDGVAVYPWSSWRAIYQRENEPISVDPLPV